MATEPQDNWSNHNPALQAHIERHFRDRRPPHEIQFELERNLKALFRPIREDSKLIFRADAKITGCPFLFELRFDAALSDVNCYTLRIQASWAKLPAEHHDYFRKSTESWFQYYTKPYRSAAPCEGSSERYAAIEAQALSAESHLKDITSIQREILARMRQGATFSKVHKEGGTVIRWREGRFISADFGESEETRTFNDEASFLPYLHQFYAWELSSHVYPDRVSDFDAWKMILRLLGH